MNRYVRSQAFPGWIYDTKETDYISPKGRTTTCPGDPFTGSVSEKELASIKSVIEKGDVEPFRYNEKKEEIVANSKVSKVEIVESIRFGDVTVTFVRVS